MKVQQGCINEIMLMRETEVGTCIDKYSSLYCMHISRNGGRGGEEDSYTSWDLVSSKGDFWVDRHPGEFVDVLGIGRAYTDENE